MSGRKHLPNSRVASPSANGNSKSSPPASQGDVKVNSLDYITFPSCDHLKRLLTSPARDLVIKNYNLSIKVSCLAYPQPGLNYSNLSTRNPKLAKNNKVAKKTLPSSLTVGGKSVPNSHSHGGADHKKLLKLRGAAIKCSQCKNNLSVNLICLQCPHVGCFDNRHGLMHSQSTHHSFAISTFGQVYCFRCNDYVSDPELEEIRINSLKSINRLSSAPGMPIYPYLPDQSKEAKKYIEENSRMPSFKASTGLRGFVNMGATCYMSTIIQTFIHNPFVREYFLSGVHEHCVKKQLNEDGCITCRIDEVFVEFFTSNSVSGFGLTKFLATCWKINKSLAGYLQQDAHEFWQFVLGEFHKSHVINSRTKALNSGDDGEKVNVNNYTRSSSISFGSNDHCNCITHRVFSGQLQSSIRCSNCENVNKTIDPMIDLLLEIKNKSTNQSYKTLDECLDWFTKPESLESNYSCTNCDQKTSASKKLSIKKLGSILTIQLKRFEHLANGSSVKLEDSIKYPVVLDMSKYCTNSISNNVEHGELSYELFAIVCHIGQVNTGHYICFIKNGDGKWFKFDDSMVTMVPHSDVLASNAYLLFYIQHQFP